MWEGCFLVQRVAGAMKRMDVEMGARVPSAFAKVVGFVAVAPLQAALVVGLALSLTTARAENYQLRNGDLLEISIFRVPELTREAHVGFDGRIAFPPLGRIDVAGLSLSDVEDLIGKGLESSSIVVDAPVTVDLIAASPVLIGGEVRTPGPYPYRTNLSVRRLIAMAGGVGRVIDNSPREIAELLALRQSQYVELLRLRAELARTQSEFVDGSDTLETLRLTASPGFEGTVIEFNARQLAFDLEEAEAQRGLQAEAVAISEERIAQLDDQLRMQRALLDAQESELSRMIGLQDRGLAAQNRVQSERRAYETMLERTADTRQQLTGARRELLFAQHEFARFEDRRANSVENEYYGLLAEISRGETRINGYDHQLAQLGYVESDAYSIERYRFVDGAEVMEIIDDGMLLEPGDMIQIVVERPRLVGDHQIGVFGGGPRADVADGD